MELQGTTAQRCHLIDDESKVGEARRDALRLAHIYGLDAPMCGRAAIVATELGNNLLRHGGGGELLLQPIVAESATLIELLAIDRGSGMQNVDLNVDSVVYYALCLLLRVALYLVPAARQPHRGPCQRSCREAS